MGCNGQLAVGTSGEVFNSRPWVRAKFTERKIVKVKTINATLMFIN